jgi:hypothetical protein
MMPVVQRGIKQRPQTLHLSQSLRSFWGIWDADASIWLVDDYKQTCYHISHVTDILQLSSNGLLCKRSKFSSEVENRAL